jgi:hypothetical protein
LSFLKSVLLYTVAKEMIKKFELLAQVQSLFPGVDLNPIVSNLKSRQLISENEGVIHVHI